MKKNVENNILNKIADFCKVKETKRIKKERENNPTLPSARCQYLIALLEKLGIAYELDTFESTNPEIHGRRYFHNIYVHGSSPYMVIAHHDVVNHKCDNSNDNSASCLNAIYLLTLRNEVQICLTDGEELPCDFRGAYRLVEKIKEGYFGTVKGLINLELTGRGGKNFFIGNYPGTLRDRIDSIFFPIIVKTPPNDAEILWRQGIDSIVITTLPVNRVGDMKFKYLDYIHTKKDSLKKISIADMNEFVEEVMVVFIDDLMKDNVDNGK